MKLYSIFFILFCSYTCHCCAWTNQNVFKKYKNKYFVESGTYEGDGITNALIAGFKEIYSIELAPYFYEKALKKFRKNKNVHIILGDSGTVLWEVIKDIDEPITFWLDGHYSGGNTGIGSNGYTPILQELDCIRRHHIKDHTILIDDVRLFGTAEFDFVTTDEILQILQEINPAYEFRYEEGCIHGDVLVAYPYIQ